MLDEASLSRSREQTDLAGRLGLLQMAGASILRKDAAASLKKRLTALVVRLRPRKDPASHEQHP